MLTNPSQLNDFWRSFVLNPADRNTPTFLTSGSFPNPPITPIGSIRPNQDAVRAEARSVRSNPAKDFLPPEQTQLPYDNIAMAKGGGVGNAQYSAKFDGANGPAPIGYQLIQNERDKAQNTPVPPEQSAWSNITGHPAQWNTAQHSWYVPGSTDFSDTGNLARGGPDYFHNGPAEERQQTMDYYQQFRDLFRQYQQFYGNR